MKLIRNRVGWTIIRRIHQQTIKIVMNIVKTKITRASSQIIYPVAQKQRNRMRMWDRLAGSISAIVVGGVMMSVWDQIKYVRRR